MSDADNIPLEIKKELIDERQESISEVKRYLRKKRSNRITIFQLALQFIFVLFFACQIIFNQVDMEQTTTIPIINLQISTQLLAFIVYIPAVILGSIGLYLEQKSIKRLVKKVCFATAVSAAESLEKNNVGNAAFFTKTLFSHIKTFANLEKITIGPWKNNLNNVSLGTIEKLHQQNNALGKAILVEPDKSKFITHFYLLAKNLFSKRNKLQYNKAVKSINFFINISQKYQEPLNFRYRHPRLDKVLMAFTEFLKLTISLFIGVILYFIFGYST